MSDFKLRAEDRARLLAGDYRPLDFELEPAFKPGARYVLAWSRARAIVDEDDGFVSRIPAAPSWYLTVTSIKRHRKGFWRVHYSVIDLRDPDLFLRRGGGYQTVPHGAADTLAIAADPATTERAQVIWREQTALRREQLDRDRRRRSQAQRLQEVKQRARLSGVDVSTDERVIEDRLQRMERKVDREGNGDQEAA